MYSSLFAGSHFLAPAIAAAAKSIPAAQLAKFGLLRGPFVGMGPVCGAFLGGAAAVAFLVPGSRKWMKEQAGRALHFVKEWSADESTESGSNGESRSTRRTQRRERAIEREQTAQTE